MVAAAASPRDTLLAKHDALRGQLQNNPFLKPLVLESGQLSDQPQGDLYAVVDYPFNAVSAALTRPAPWCDVLIMHVNTKYCHPVQLASGAGLRVHMGTKSPEALRAGTRIEFSFQVPTAGADYFQVLLWAPQGLMGARDNRLTLEATALSPGKTFLHLSYGYTEGWMARLAMRTYLATVARDTVGFTVRGTLPDGQPDYVDGVRGVVERNAMRYYLAVEAYLDSLQAAPADPTECRLQSWFAAAEKYPRQLQSMTLAEYLSMKRDEILRQQTLQ